MAIATTREKSLHELGDIHDAEHRFLKGRQGLLQAATDATLQSGIERHIAGSERQITNPEQAFQLLVEQAKAEPCDAAQGIVTEGRKNLEEAGTNRIRDCLIGTSLTKAEHDEIVSYRG